jgi:HD-GYP domain-containing protein (c-di-GMP phosphodiesterase class II)
MRQDGLWEKDVQLRGERAGSTFFIESSGRAGIDYSESGCQSFGQSRKSFNVPALVIRFVQWIMAFQSLSRDLHSILNSYLDLVGCDGGSIYTLEKNLQGESVLVFKAMITRSLGVEAVPFQLKSQIFRLDELSTVGKTGLHRRVFKEGTFQAAQQTADGSIPVKSRSIIDISLGYETVSMLSAPLLTPRGDLVGVIQLVNKNPDETGTESYFDEKDERLCEIVSSQAALVIENSTLLVEQEKILDGFVNACVTAIEARDPVTSGHSQRVCDLSLNLAKSVNRVERGKLGLLHFSETQLRELRYAAMLHDIGKISVKEDILKKEKKLFPWELHEIEMRFKLMKATYRLEYHGPGKEFELAKKIRELDRAYQMILAANEPTILPQEVSASILELTKLQVEVAEGEVCCALHAHESERLCITRGSLSKEERLEIEKHVSFTYEILKMVPWGRGLENVPLIAHRHHEKLDGSGYPAKVKAEEIPIQSRMLTIADIYDALTAKDRPYKAAVPIDRALAILEDEVKEGKLDPELFRLFVDSRAYILPGTQKVKKAA